MFMPRPSPFIAEFAHTQLHSALARVITDRVNGEGLGSEAKRLLLAVLVVDCSGRTSSGFNKLSIPM